MKSPSRTLVWIDAERATIVRWDGAATLTHIESEVPRHRRLGGHVARDSRLRTIGSPPPDRHRLEHLRRHVHAVADAISPADDVEVIGPGTVHEHLVDLLTDEDRLHRRSRSLESAAIGPLSEAQLIARVRTAAGDPPRRGRRQLAETA